MSPDLFSNELISYILRIELVCLCEFSNHLSNA